MDKIQALKNAIAFAKQNPDSPQAIQLRKRIESGMYNTELAQIKAESQPKPEGFLKSVAKDVAETLVVKPVARATEAATRLLAPESMSAKGYEEMADKGESQNIMGINVEAQKGFGEGGLRQIGGEALKTASYLFPYGKVAQGAGAAILGGSKLTPAALGISKVAGKVISGATGGYAADVGYKLADENKTIGEAFTPGLGTAIGAGVPLVGPATRVVGRGIKKVGEKAVESVIPVSTREAGIMQTYKANNPFLKRVADVLGGTEKAPTTAGKTTVTKGLVGTKSGIGVQAKRAASTLWSDFLSPKLKANQNAVELDGFFTKIQDDIIKTTPEKSRQKALLNALESFKEDYAGTKVVSLEGLQKLKEGWAEFIPEKAYRGENISGSANQVRKLMAGEARQTIYDQLGPEAKQAYFDYGNLQGLQKLGQVSMTGQKLKGGAGSFVSELFNRAVTPIATIGGQGVYQLGKGIEFVGNIGAKNLGQALGIKAGLKFPGDVLVEDLGASAKSLKGTGEIPKQLTLHERLVSKNIPLKQYTKEHLDQIEKQILGDKSKAVVIDADTIKKMHPEFNPKNPGALHEESSAISKELVEKAIDEDTSGVFKMIGGGSGSGKSEVVLLKIGNKPGVIFDGTLGGLDSAIKKIDYALSKGKKVELHPVYTPPKLAALFNQMRARNVAEDVLISSHVGMRNNVPELYAKFGKKIKVIPYQNRVFDASREYQGELIDPKKVQGFLNGMKMSEKEVADEVRFISDHIKEYGIDFTKSIINDIL